MSGRPELYEFVQRARNVRHQAELDAATVEVLDAFTLVGVEPLVLKGAALARMLYRAEERRGYCDIDLLVARDHLVPARQALAELGYGNASEPIGADDIAGTLHAEIWWGPQQNPTGLARMIDLHWRLPGCDAPPDVIWSVLGARRTWIDLNGRAVPVLARDGLALHLATHAAQHGPHDLKALADLARGLERWSTDVWRSAARLAEQVGGTAAFAAGLRLTAAGTKLAGEFGLPPSDDFTWAILNRDTRPRGTFHLLALGRARGVRERINVLRRSLLPHRNWITWQYPWAKDSGRARLAAAYGKHVLRAPAWAVRAWRYRRRERRAARYR